MAKTGFETKNGFSANPCGFEQITALSSAKGLTAPTTRGKVHAAVITVSGQNVRWRDDGTNPSATSGVLLKTTDPPFEYTGDLSAIKFFEVSASATLDVSYYQLED